MEQVRSGSEEAARELLEIFGPHIIRVVRRKLDQRLRARFDSADFAQDVWASFFANPPRHEVVDRPEALIAFLVRMARNKVVDAHRKGLVYQKENVTRQNSLDGSAALEAKALSGTDPTPSQAAAAREEWQRLPGHYQRILLLLGEGKTHVEIAREVGVNEKTVRRVFRRYVLGDSS